MFEYIDKFVETSPTLESYFEQEYLSAVRHEFIHGEIIPMTYTSPEHGTIVQNLSRLVGNCLHRKKAQIWVNTLNDLYEKVVFPLRTTGSAEK